MFKRIALVLSALMIISVGLVSPTLAQSPTLYACNGGSGGGATDPGAMMTINQSTGAGTVLNVPYVANAGIAGCDYNSKGELFAVTGFSGTVDGKTHLLKLNPTTGALISDVGPLQTAGSVDGVIADISFQPGTDVLFGVTANNLSNFGLPGGSGGYLLTINTSTAIVTVVSPASMSGANDAGGLAFTPSGTLYFTPMWNNDLRILTINPATGVATNGPAGVVIATNMMGLEVNPVTGELWGSSYDTNGDIYKINPTTGALIFVGSAGNRSVHDLAFYSVSTAVGGVAMPINQTTSPFNFTMLVSAAALVLGLGLVVLGRVRRAQA